MKTRLLSMVLVIMLLMSCLPLTTQAAEQSITITRRALVLAAPDDGSIGAVSSTNYEGMRNTFLRNGITNTVLHQQAEGGCLDTVELAIYTQFKNADDDDVNYIYINSHGRKSDGALYINGYSGECLELNTLKSWLNKRKGHFVIMFDSCYSGFAINSKSGENDESAEENESDINYAQKMVDGFLSEDNQPKGSRSFNNGKYTVICSCLSTENAWGINNPNIPISYLFATYHYGRGLGYNILTGTSLPWQADGDSQHQSDGILTIQEFFDYVSTRVASLAALENLSQTVCFYSGSPYYSILYNYRPLGDVNTNKTVTSADVLLLRKYIAGQANLNNTQKKLADMNGDQNVSMADVFLLQQYVANTI